MRVNRDTHVQCVPISNTDWSRSSARFELKRRDGIEPNLRYTARQNNKLSTLNKKSGQNKVPYAALTGQLPSNRVVLI